MMATVLAMAEVCPRCISIVVEPLEVVEGSEAADVIVIAGDALPTLNNFLKGVLPALHVDRRLAISSMSRITEDS